MDRRGFLRGGLALGCSAAAFPLMTPIAFASAPGDNRLVVIVLRGAMDGLDAVQPVADPLWRELRPTLAGDPDGMIDAGGGFALHPALAPLAPLWTAGQAGAVQAVSTPYRDRRSHFDGQDILEAGLPDLTGGGLRDGWLNRFLQILPGAEADTAYAIGRERMLILTGEAPTSSWSPDAKLALSPQARRLLEMVNHEDPLFNASLAEALTIAEAVERDRAAEAGAPGGDHVRLARFAASRLAEASRIASFSLSGWDTHARQGNALGTALGRLAEVILTLQEGLGPVWDRTAVLCVTEFGRTVRENGTGGTDHGTGGALLFAGGALRGGRVLGDWPGLAEGSLYAGRDLLPTRDLRAHAAWVLRGLYGTAVADLEQRVFPGLDMGPDTGILA